MDPVTLTILIVLCRMVIIHSLLNIYRALLKVAPRIYSNTFLIGMVMYIFYLSTNTVSHIPHTFNDFLRVLSGAIAWYIAAKFIWRKKSDG